MSFLLALIPTLCYGGIVISEAIKGNYPIALVFLGYTIGNLGFLWMFLK